LEKGADLSLFGGGTEEHYETADFPLSELDLNETTLAALSAAGYDTFLQIIDLERADFLAITGLGEPEADRLLQLIDELTVVESEASEPEDEAGSLFDFQGEPPSEEEAGVEAEARGGDDGGEKAE
jgi:hypothetical protein